MVHEDDSSHKSDKRAVSRGVFILFYFFLKLSEVFDLICILTIII